MQFSFFTNKTPKQQTFIILGVFALLILIFYGNTLQNGFVYDDHQQIRDNEYVHSLRYLDKVITGCIWENAVGTCQNTVAYYRPLQTLSYLLTYQISSAPFIFHLVNLLYYFGIVSLIYLLGRALTRNMLLAFVASTLFLIHPLQTEVVNWASAVPELTFAIFVLLSFLFFVKYRTESLFSGSLWSVHRNLLFSGAFYFLAILSKEPAIFLPILFVFYDLVVLRNPLPNFLQGGKWKEYLPFVGAVAVYVPIRVAVFGGDVFGEVQHFGPFSVAERLYAFVTLFAQYIEKFLFPYPLLFFYTYIRSSDFLSLKFLLSFVVLAAFFAGIVYFIKIRRPMLAMHMVWIIFLFPVLIAINRVGENIFSERYLFVPSIGFSFLIASGFVLLWDWKKQFRIWFLLLSALVILISFVVVVRQNTVWRDNEALYPKTLAINPMAHSVRFNYGVLLRNEKNDFKGAKREFEEILKLDDTWFDNTLIYVHLGDYYRDVRGDEEKAIEFYQKSVESAASTERSYLGYGRMGALHAINENYIEALPYFCKAFQANPDTESTQGNFNRVSGILADLAEEDPEQLKDDFVKSDTFEKSEVDRIEYRETSCNEENCMFSFFLKLEGVAETILPFLILAEDRQGNFVELTNRDFNSQTSEALLETSADYEDKVLTFFFPTCEGIYYEVLTQL